MSHDDIQSLWNIWIHSFNYTHNAGVCISVVDLEIQKGGLATGAWSTLANLVLPRPLSITLAVRTEYLKATLGLIKCLEISKELICECVTMPGCYCMPLLYNHLMDSCSYVLKNRLLAAKAPPLPPLNPPLLMAACWTCMFCHFSV